MDRKRVSGPESSCSPIFKKAIEEFDLAKRLDKRASDDLRQICESFLF